jgi:hypothetical protein
MNRRTPNWLFAFSKKKERIPRLRDPPLEADLTNQFAELSGTSARSHLD